MVVYMKKLFVSLLLLVPAAMSAQESASTSAAMPFLDRTHGAVRSSLAGLGSGLSSDAFAHWGDVSGTVFSEGTFNAGVAYGLFQPTATKANIVDAGAVWNFRNRLAFTAGVSFAADRLEHRYDEYGVALSDFRPTSLTAGIGVAYRITDCLSAGAAFNYASASGLDKNLQAFAADIKLTFRKDGMNISAFANNLGTSVKAEGGERFSIPTSAGVEAGYGLDLGKSSLYGAVQGQCWFGGPSAFSPSAAVEYSYDKFLFCRAGYHYGSKKNGLPSYAALGLGVRLGGVSVDLSWNAASGVMRNTFVCGLGFNL